MPEKINIQVWPREQENVEAWQKKAARKLGISPQRISKLVLKRRSVDARRGRSPRYNLQLEAWVDEAYQAEPPREIALQQVADKPEVHIVGLGPGGLFAALRLIEAGYKPVVLERGKAVRDRRRDLALLNREGIVNPESNYCFGEGGAGTFSDGKLYTRSKKRGNTQAVLDLLVQFGASPDILIDAHPHIGTNKLPKIIQAMREQIVSCGGEVLFDHKLTDIQVVGGKLKGLEVNGKEVIPAKALILATGHSARDIFQLLHRQQLLIEPKPFALGVRVEHPQDLIDRIQYNCDTTRPDGLPAASYSLVKQVEGKGVFSFCMCPGGIICPAATAPGELVVNGWSPSMRNTGYANSGMVVSVELADFFKEQDPLAGVAFQHAVEQRAEQAGGGKQVAPAQRLQDFVDGKFSASLPDCSYLPGLRSADLGEVLPTFVQERLQEGFKAFGRKLKGYLSNEAVVVAVESRTSSPVRIPRDQESLMHPQCEGLFPCGEGAGYAGGIMSAAMDGERVAQAVGKWVGD
jgi:uncharacterized FAD-dependent dehydrogenase